MRFPCCTTCDSCGGRTCADEGHGCGHCCPECVCPTCAEVHCGRIDDHEPHPWTRPALGGGVPAVDYWCPGPPVTEGAA